MQKIYALSVAALAGAVKLDGERSFDGYAYKHYLSEFGKTFESDRQAVFEGNLEQILKHNAKEDKTWYATVNKFTDMTNEEFRTVYHGHIPPAPGTFPQADLSEFEHKELPKEVDWRKKSGVVTKTKNQGPCGSCWAFSATETLESIYAIQNNVDAPILSPQQLVSCTPNPDHCGGTGGCSGATQPLAFNYTMGAGLTTENNYPYQAKTTACDESKIVPVVKNSGYVELKTNDYTALATAVANVGPISISLAAGGFGWQIYGGGIYSTQDYVMDHGVQLVGYGKDYLKNKMYWIIRNSWGAGWGEGGYMKIERFGEGQEPCGMDNEVADGFACAGDTTPVEYCGMCAILSASSYPTGVTKA